MDGAIFEYPHCYRIGVVIRNDRGQIIGAMTKKLHLPLGALEVETKAAEEGIILARDLGLGEVVVEGDSMTVMSALSGVNHPPCPIQKVVESSVHMLRRFKDWEAKYVGRNSNVAAHQLARKANSISDAVIWVEDILLAIVNQVLLDVASMGCCPY